MVLCDFTSSFLKTYFVIFIDPPDLQDRHHQTADDTNVAQNMVGDVLDFMHTWPEGPWQLADICMLFNSVNTTTKEWQN